MRRGLEAPASLGESKAPGGGRILPLEHPRKAACPSSFPRKGQQEPRTRGLLSGTHAWEDQAGPREMTGSEAINIRSLLGISGAGGMDGEGPAGLWGRAITWTGDSGRQETMAFSLSSAGRLAIPVLGRSNFLPPGLRLTGAGMAAAVDTGGKGPLPGHSE